MKAADMMKKANEIAKEIEANYDGVTAEAISNEWEKFGKHRIYFSVRVSVETLSGTHYEEVKLGFLNCDTNRYNKQLGGHDIKTFDASNCEEAQAVVDYKAAYEEKRAARREAEKAEEAPAAEKAEEAPAEEAPAYREPGDVDVATYTDKDGEKHVIKVHMARQRRYNYGTDNGKKIRFASGSTVSEAIDNVVDVLIKRFRSGSAVSITFTDAVKAEMFRADVLCSYTYDRSSYTVRQMSAQEKATRKYNDKAYEAWTLHTKKGIHDEIKKVAEKAGMSLAGFVVEACQEKAEKL